MAHKLTIRFQKTMASMPILSSQLLFIVACALCVVSSSSAQRLGPEGVETNIRGTIRLVHGFGPPGYGEDRKHDAHVSYWALELSYPLNLPCKAKRPADIQYECQSARRLNLFFEGGGSKRLNDLPAAKWKDRQVTVQGKLHRWDTVGEMTAIYMDVTQINGSTVGSTPVR